LKFKQCIIFWNIAILFLDGFEVNIPFRAVTAVVARFGVFRFGSRKCGQKLDKFLGGHLIFKVAC
jgi:hypothetical protein